MLNYFKRSLVNCPFIWYVIRSNSADLDGPYSVFAGRDASRGLAMFSVSEDVIREEYDDLSDLNGEQMERVKEWEQQLSGK